jgi:N-acetylglucosamine-6-phosphate deacetylase
MPDGDDTLGGQPVHLENGIAKLPDGTIAGSATDLYQGMQNAVKFGISKEEAILSATLNHAKAIGAEGEIGSIAPGKRADFVACDEKLNRKQVYLAGKRME